ncbi:MAG: NTP transferase domain-containing protein [Oscillospiraceae bacterium]|nr:NTP transferase domain-containing protein [Oscillospiraceae bacterium]
MKAVIMAGGEGTRLRPLSLGRPKPMTPLFDRPVMEHIISLLRRHGITDIAVTLQYMPRVVMDYFGDGSQHGVRLHYFVEEQPLGTAGSVKNCMPFLGEDDFLVISGDAVCDLDLSACIAFHKTRRSIATLVLYAHPAPLEYGLVLTEEDGRITGFIEKPGWGQVMTNMVNTGVYLLTALAMEQVPEDTPYDFGKDLFPALLKRGNAMYGYAPDGYWCDMGDGDAYLQCVSDALSGKVSVAFGVPEISPGVWSAIPIPASVKVLPPCYIGAGCAIGEGSLIGSHTALGKGCSVGRKAMVQHTAMHDGASADDHATLYGSIVCRGARVGRGAVLNEGAVLGEACTIGAQSVIMERVKIWPNRAVPPEARQWISLTAGGLRAPLKFADGAVLRGTIGEELTPEGLVLLGNIIGGEGRAGLGDTGGDGARMLAQAAACGMSAAGCRILETDASCPAAGAWAARQNELPTSLFVEQTPERIYLHLFDACGLPLDRARQRKLEGALLRGEQSRVTMRQIRMPTRVEGIAAHYARAAAAYSGGRQTFAHALTVAVPRYTPADNTLAQSLTELGCQVLRTDAEGVVAFYAEHGGFRLRARDETGAPLGWDTLLTILGMLSFATNQKEIAVPPAAPAALETLAEQYGGRVLRLTRDGNAALELYRALPFLRDAAFAACRLCVWMAKYSEALHTIAGRIPAFRTVSREVPLTADRGRVMQALTRSERSAEPMGEGVRLHTGSGWVYIAPLTRRASLRVIAEGMDAEVADELCSFYTEKAKMFDKGNAAMNP